MKRKGIVLYALLCVTSTAYAAQSAGGYDVLAFINPNIQDDEWDRNFNTFRTYINYQSREDQTLQQALSDLKELSKEVRAVFETLPVDSNNLNALYNQTEYFRHALASIDSFESKLSKVTFVLWGKRASQRKILDILQAFKKQIRSESDKISTQPLDRFNIAIAKEEEDIRKGSETMLLNFVINVDIQIWNKAVEKLRAFVVKNSSDDARMIDSLNKIVDINADVMNFIKLPLPGKSEQVDEFRFTMTMIDAIKSDLIQAQKKSAFVQAGCRKLLITCLSLIEDIAKKALDIFVNQKQQFQS